MPYVSIAVGSLASTEKYFDHFEVELHSDASGSNRLGVQEVKGTYNLGDGKYEQSVLCVFPNASVGTTYYLRSRVIDAYGNASAWAPFISLVATTNPAPSVTYTPSSSPSGGGVVINSGPSTSDTNIDHYEFWWAMVNSAPSAGTAANLPTSHDGDTSIIFPQGQIAYVWVRAVSTAGVKQTWTALGPFTSPAVGASQPEQGQLIDSAYIGIIRVELMTPNSPWEGFLWSGRPGAIQPAFASEPFPNIACMTDALQSGSLWEFMADTSSQEGSSDVTSGFLNLSVAVNWELMLIFRWVSAAGSNIASAVNDGSVTTITNYIFSQPTAVGVVPGEQISIYDASFPLRPYNGTFTIASVSGVSDSIATFGQSGTPYSYPTIGAGITHAVPPGNQTLYIGFSPEWPYGISIPGRSIEGDNALWVRFRSQAQGVIDPYYELVSRVSGVDVLSDPLNVAPDYNWHRLRIWCDALNTVHAQIDQGHIATISGSLPSVGMRPNIGATGLDSSGGTGYIPGFEIDYLHFGFVNIGQQVDPTKPRWF